MKRFRIVSLIVLTITILFLTTGCGEYQKDIYADDSIIAKAYDSYTFVSRSGSTTPNESNIKYGAFVGMETIWVIESEGDGSFTIEYDSKVKKGEFKVVLITPDNKVRNILEQNEEGTIKIKAGKGKSRVKIVGNEAGGECLLKIETQGDAVIKKFD
tara:strand:- start:191 stop:661 length:471 start_codon:yes stop_codon:yes gene_type:complete